MRRIMIATGLALSGALLVGGCQFGGGGGSGEKQTGKAAPPSSPAASASSGAVSAPKKSITYPGLAPGGTVTVGFQGLQVHGQLAQLSLTWTPRVPGNDTNSWSIGEMASGDITGGGDITLVDTQNLKRYVVVQDSEQHVLGTSGDAPGVLNHTGPQTSSGQTTPSTYTYAAPPPNVTSIDVYADDHMLFNVPITR